MCRYSYLKPMSVGGGFSDLPKGRVGAVSQSDYDLYSCVSVVIHSHVYLFWMAIALCIPKRALLWVEYPYLLARL